MAARAVRFRSRVVTATPERQLAQVLRALHLTGMLDTLEIRLAEARAGTLGHVEFLQVLMEDELARREAAGVSRRIRAAGFPVEATLEDFDFSYNKDLPVSTIRDLARLEFIQAGEGLLLYGPVGVGKSHVAIGLGHLACRRGYDVTFTTCSKLLAELAGGHADRSFAARLRKLAKPALLIVDDWAMREFTAVQADDLFELLQERLARPGRSLVLTSNRSPSDWYPLFPNAVVGESILDRVLNSSHHVLLEGKSYRPTKRPGRRTS
ncbi:MAG: IS21-like element helper ATPase IstB [Acidimicrobiaceae bacterium]|nr:IS21-like element helper ATPase IstB [Acidimicrobiaceae bacterium]